MSGITASDLEGAENVLVLSSGDSVVDVFTGELFPHVATEDATFLCMTFTRDPEAWLDAWESGVGTQPARAGLVGVGDQTGGHSSLPDLESEETVSFERVADPSDLPRLGITLSEFLTRWDAAGPAILAFDSVTALLQYADLQRVYRFLHTLKGRLGSADAISFYHLDPAAHDGRTVATLRPLFDLVVREEDGELVLDE
jgi:hypothetical protein